MAPDVWQMLLINYTRDERSRTAAIQQLYFEGMLPGEIAVACQLDDWIVQDCILGRR
jgi:hypothetical protein